MQSGWKESSWSFRQTNKEEPLDNPSGRKRIWLGEGGNSEQGASQLCSAVSWVHQTGNGETTALNEAGLRRALRIWNVITLNQIIFLLLTSGFFLLTNSCGPFLPPLCSTCDFSGTRSRRHSHMRVSYFDFQSAHRFRAEHLFVSLCPSLQSSDPTVLFAKKRQGTSFLKALPTMFSIFHPLFCCHHVNSNKYNNPPAF